MVIAYSRAGHDTYRQNSRPSLSATQPVHPRLASPRLTTTPNSLAATPLSSATTRNPSGQTAPVDLMCEVALKIISKKRVKESGESVWSEMRVAPGSQQRESRFPTRLFSMMCLRTRPRLSLTCLVVFL